MQCCAGDGRPDILGRYRRAHCMMAEPRSLWQAMKDARSCAISMAAAFGCVNGRGGPTTGRKIFTMSVLRFALASASTCRLRGINMLAREASYRGGDCRGAGHIRRHRTLDRAGPGMLAERLEARSRSGLRPSTGMDLSVHRDAVHEPVLPECASLLAAARHRGWTVFWGGWSWHIGWCSRVRPHAIRASSCTCTIAM